MSGTPYLLPAIAALTVFLLYMIAMQITGKQGSTRERMQRLVGMGEAEPVATEAIADPLHQDHVPSGLCVVLGGILRAVGIDVETFRRKNQMKFYRSGISSPDAAVFYLFYKRIGFIVFIFLGYLIASNAGTGIHKLLYYFVAGIAVFLGITGADMYLKNCRDKREKVLQRSFPDALDLLLVCVESGLALDGALSRVCKELGRAHPQITAELNRTRLELTLLNDRTTALTNLAERTDMLAFRSLVTTLLQSEKFGTSLTETLRVLSEDFRNTRLMLAEDKAGRLPVLMTIPLITLMMPALFLLILGPAIIKVTHMGT